MYGAFREKENAYLAEEVLREGGGVGGRSNLRHQLCGASRPDRGSACFDLRDMEETGRVNYCNTILPFLKVRRDWVRVSLSLVDMLQSD